MTRHPTTPTPQPGEAASALPAEVATWMERYAMAHQLRELSEETLTECVTARLGLEAAFTTALAAARRQLGETLATNAQSMADQGLETGEWGRGYNIACLDIAAAIRASIRSLPSPPPGGSDG